MTRLDLRFLAPSLLVFSLACAGNPTEAMSAGSIGSAGTDTTGASSATDDTQGTETGDPPESCGNGVLEEDEDCDLGDLNGNGDVACRTNCLVNVCGDGYDGPGEGCDDGNQIDGDACTDCATASCGDMTIDRDEGEECDDGNDIDGDTCTNCQLPTCGDMSIDDTEECEAGVPIRITCSDVNMMFDAGELQCSGDCHFETNACSDCGDGNVSGAEQCDGANLGGNQCSSIGFVGGALGCMLQTCQFDVVGCTNCGNGMIDDNEACDGLDFGGVACIGPGDIACTPACMLDMSDCEDCGNGAIDEGEECDDDILPQSMCSELVEGYDVGALVCLGCQYDTTACCHDDVGDPCPNGPDECCGSLECGSGVCCTEVLGTACDAKDDCCETLNCNSGEGNVCCTSRLAAPCGDDNECCGALDCDGAACCTDVPSVPCDADAPNDDAQCCDPLICDDTVAGERCCIPPTGPCINNAVGDAECCSGNCNGNGMCA